MVSAQIQRATFFVPKGGVGKTTSAAHVAAAAHKEHGRDVLLMDLAGKQNDLATQFGIADEVQDPDAPVSAVFGENWEFIRDNIDDLVDRMTFETDEGPDLIPADAGLSAADNNLTNLPPEERYARLESFINELIAPDYDIVILDLPGKDDNITLNGLFAAENVVAPLKPGAFERDQLDSLEADLRELREEFGDADNVGDPELSMVFPTMHDARIDAHDRFVADINEKYNGLAGETVNATANISNEQAAGRTLFALDEDGLYSSGERAREAYSEITDDLLDRLEAR